MTSSWRQIASGGHLTVIQLLAVLAFDLGFYAVVAVCVHALTALAWGALAAGAALMGVATWCAFLLLTRALFSLGPPELKARRCGIALGSGIALLMLTLAGCAHYLAELPFADLASLGLPVIAIMAGSIGLFGYKRVLRNLCRHE